MDGYTAWDIYNMSEDDINEMLGEGQQNYIMDVTSIQEDAQTGNIWSANDLYGIGVGASVSESEFTSYTDPGEDGQFEVNVIEDRSTLGMIQDFEAWENQQSDFIAGGGDWEGGTLIQYQGSEFQHAEQSYLKELQENYNEMSTNILKARAKTFSDKKKLRATEGKTNFAGSGTMNRASSRLDQSHKKSVFDSYSNFLEDRSGISQDILGARDDWWNFNQDIMNETLDI